MINIMKKRVESFSRRNRLPNCDLISRKKITRIKDEPIHKVHPEENYLAVGGREKREKGRVDRGRTGRKIRAGSIVHRRETWSNMYHLGRTTYRRA